jgi:CheY-like chemotaxis protein
LSAVAGIVRSLRGAIRVESAPEAGTSFTVLLPAAAGELAGAQYTLRDTHVPRGKGIVLLVDDEEIVRETARSALERNGYTVLVAGNGTEAIEIAGREPVQIDLIVLDLSMPGLSGEETLLNLRSVRPDVPVIVSSGHTEGHALRGFADMPVSGFIQKPYTSHALSGAVGRILTQ